MAAALPQQAAAFSALLSLPVYGALIGMFELNNLGGQVLNALRVTLLYCGPSIGNCKCDCNPPAIMGSPDAWQSHALCTCAPVGILQSCQPDDGQACCMVLH